jgi:hypothetical protein
MTGARHTEWQGFQWGKLMTQDNPIKPVHVVQDRASAIETQGMFMANKCTLSTNVLMISKPW